VEPQPDEEAIGAVGRRRCQLLTGDRDDARALLARALGNQLFDPQAEWLERGRQDHVSLSRPARAAPPKQASATDGFRQRAANPGSDADSMAIAHPTSAPMFWPISAAGTRPEERQRRVPAADVAWVDEEIAKPFDARAARQLRPFVVIATKWSAHRWTPASWSAFWKWPQARLVRWSCLIARQQV